MHPQLTPRWIERFWSKVDRSGGRDACWPWLRGLTERGYGRASCGATPLLAHRVAYYLTYGEWPDPLGLHTCDNPPCCNPAHVFPGTQAENMADKAAKGRAPAGDEHWARRRPDWVLRGENHWSRENPERYARGDAHGSKTHPGCYPSGDAHYTRRLPERVKRGERQHAAKLTEQSVREIREARAFGATIHALAKEYGVTPATISRVVNRLMWAHVD